MTITAEHRSFLDGFRDLERQLAGDGPAWLRDLRRAARERFDTLGLPDGRTEAWRSTPVAPLVETGFRPADGPAPPAALPPGIVSYVPAGPRLVLVDGLLCERASDLGGLPDGVWAGGLAAALERAPERVRAALETAAADPGPTPSPFAALNGAFLRDAAVIVVDPGVAVGGALSVVQLTRGGAAPVLATPRLLVLVGANATLRLVEVQAGDGDGGYLSAPAADVILDAGARVDHLRMQFEAPAGLHVGSLCGRLGRDAHYDCCAVTLGGRLVRNDVRIVLGDTGGHCNLSGLTLSRGREHVDNHTTLEHAAPHCDSRELYKSILGDRSRSVFTGRIIVRQDAQQTDAKQSNPNLLLSPDALAHTRPQLEIYADDVKCTHGATIGRLDEDAIFYLRSRGIPAVEARDLLVHAFAGEVLERIEDDAVRGALEAAVEARLRDGGAAG